MKIIDRLGDALASAKLARLSVSTRSTRKVVSGTGNICGRKSTHRYVDAGLWTYRMIRTGSMTLLLSEVIQSS